MCVCWRINEEYISFEFHRLIAKYRKRARVHYPIDNRPHCATKPRNTRAKIEKELYVLFVNRIQSNWIMTIMNVSSRKMRIHWTRIIYIFSIPDLPRTFFIVLYLYMHLYRKEEREKDESKNEVNASCYRVVQVHTNHSKQSLAWSLKQKFYASFPSSLWRWRHSIVINCIKQMSIGKQ